MDYISNSFLMPIIFLLNQHPDRMGGRAEVDRGRSRKNGEHFSRAGMYSFLIRYIVPAVMLVLFLVSTGFINML